MHVVHAFVKRFVCQCNDCTADPDIPILKQAKGKYARL
jgi:hypothetical protein